MIEEMNAKAKAAENFREIAMRMTRRKDVKVEKAPTSALAALAPFLEKLKIKR